jgi:hypothetical protein
VLGNIRAESVSHKFEIVYAFECNDLYRLLIFLFDSLFIEFDLFTGKFFVRCGHWVKRGLFAQEIFKDLGGIEILLRDSKGEAGEIKVWFFTNKFIGQSVFIGIGIDSFEDDEAFACF